jgi:hypothetical protein
MPKVGKGCNLTFTLVDNKIACFTPIFSSLYNFLYSYIKFYILHAHVYDRITRFITTLVLYLTYRLIPMEDQEFLRELEQEST